VVAGIEIKRYFRFQQFELFVFAAGPALRFYFAGLECACFGPAWPAGHSGVKFTLENLRDKS
jgi:hypothetical protein